MSETGIVTRLSDKIADAWWKTFDFLNGRRVTTNLKRQGETLPHTHSAGSGEFKEAAAASGDIALTGPDLVAAFEAQGELLDMSGQTEKAMSLYEAGRKLKWKLRPGTPDRTFVLRRAGRSTAEIASYTSVLQNVKQRVHPFIARGNAFLAEGQPDAALADYEAALKVKPGLSDVVALKAEAFLMSGRLEEAAAAFDKACADQPRNAEFLSGRAIARLALGRLQDADADWRLQFDLLPKERASARACVMLRLADYEKALPELDRALEKEPCDPYWQLYQVTALRRLGRSSAPGGAPTPDVWPGPLIGLHVGTLSAGQVLTQADNRQQKGEAHFQLGVLALAADPAKARGHFNEVVDGASPSMIEYAAARHELVRLGS